MGADISEQLFDLYERELRLLANPSCAACDAKIKQPVAAWHVGRDFSTAAQRVLFVGKPHRGVPGHVRPSGIVDPRELVGRVLRHKHWPYWRYTIEIAGQIHGTKDRGWARIAMTNIIKCTNVTAGAGSADLTSQAMLTRCVTELGVLSAEIRLLKPTHVILYTANLFPGAFNLTSLGAASAWREVFRGTKPCGRKQLSWWERNAESSWGGALHVLVTGHPERMKRTEYTRLIAEWVGSA